MLEDFPDANVRVLAIWEPMLPTDWARPGGSVLSRLHDTRAIQYWDPDHRFAKELRKRLASDPKHPQPNCCEDNDIPWDLVAVYSAESKWEESLPLAVFADGPVYRVKQDLWNALSTALKSGK